MLKIVLQNSMHMRDLEKAKTNTLHLRRDVLFAYWCIILESIRYMGMRRSLPLGHGTLGFFIRLVLLSKVTELVILYECSFLSHIKIRAFNVQGTSPFKTKSPRNIRLARQ